MFQTFSVELPEVYNEKAIQYFGGILIEHIRFKYETTLGQLNV